MKAHFVTILFKTRTTVGKDLIFQGLVTGKESNGKLIISPSKLFKSAFKIDMPNHTGFTIL